MYFLHKALAGLLIGALAGVLLARLDVVSYQFMFASGLLFVFLSAFVRRVFIVAMVLFGVGFGVFRSSTIINGHEYVMSQHGAPVVLSGVVESDPAYHKTGQFEFFVQTDHLNGVRVASKIKVRGFVNDIQRKDRLSVSGKLYDGFASWQGSVYFAEAELLDRNPSVIETFRAQFISNVYSVMPDPEASLGLGFLIGIRTLLPDTLVTQLSATGLTHIVAVSGYNLTILVNLSRRLFSKLSRFQSLFFSISFLAVFVTVTGFSPSILRATIVSGVGLFAWYYGKPAGAFLLLLYSSSISALVNPVYVWYDVGWYLSLSAFFGILVVAPMIQNRIFKGKQPKLIAQILIETTSAQIMTLPIVLFVFGDLSTVAIVANLLVLPFIPIAMILTFLVGISYFLSWWLASLIMWPCYLVLSFIVNVIAAISGFKYALVSAPLNGLQLISVYCAFGLSIFLFARRVRQAVPATDQI